jgi:hypothetical protein
MFELDRGEMPIHRRKSKDQTHYAKKMPIYYEAFKAGEHRRELGIARTNSLTRSVWQTMAKWFKK